MDYADHDRVGVDAAAEPGATALLPELRAEHGRRVILELARSAPQQVEYRTSLGEVAGNRPVAAELGVISPSRRRPSCGCARGAPLEEGAG